jgi:hypothetical protein
MTDDEWQEWLNQLMANSCSRCWDADEDMTSIALRYVQHLEDNVPEHRRHAWMGCEEY